MLESRFRDSWWTEGEFLDLVYRKRLLDLLLFFAVFALLIFSPLCLYACFAGRYARNFFRIQKYMDRLPPVKGLLERREDHEDGRPDLSVARLEVVEGHSAGMPVIEQFQQYLLKLLEAVDYWREQSNVDELTGLLNRKGLNQICAYEMNRMKRYGSMFSLIMVDIDHFKKINDEHGHDVGDWTLKSLSGALSQTFRANDYIGRWGGEEFLIILPDTSLDGAVRVAEGARQSIEKLMIQVGEILVRLTISLGVASSEHKAEFAETLSYADKSLYLAKQNGRNQVWAFAYQDGFSRFPDVSAQLLQNAD